MKKKSIAFFGIKFYPSKGGTSRVAESIIRELKDDYDITIYCYSDPEAGSYLDRVKVIQLPKIPLGPFGVFTYYALCCLHILLFGNYDLIHVHKTDAAFFIRPLSWKSKIIATSHEAPYKRDKWKFIGKTYFRLMESLFMRSPATLTSVSKPLAEYYQRTFNREVNYLPNGVDIDPRRDFAAADACLARHGVEGEFIFFAARRIMSTKGCHTLLKAMQAVGYKGTIVIAGEDSHGTAYMESIRSLAKTLNVKFIGFISSKPMLMALIARAKFFMFPSEIEGLSLMLLEVASNGATPLICSDIPENTQVFTDKEVLFFRNKDVNDLAEKFNWAQQHPEEMAERMERAEAFVRQNYASEISVARYNKLYKEILGLEKSYAKL